MDYPYQHSVEEVHLLDKMDMSADVKKAFFQTNAEAVFKLASDQRATAQT
jgi:2,3-dihydroxybenzoate decarboxylase